MATCQRKSSSASEANKPVSKESTFFFESNPGRTWPTIWSVESDDFQMGKVEWRPPKSKEMEEIKRVMELEKSNEKGRILGGSRDAA